MNYEDHPGKIHRQQYGKSDKANSPDNQNPDWQEGYAWGIETYAYNGTLVLRAEIEFRGEFALTGNGFSEWKRGFWAARCQMTAAGFKKKKVEGSPLE